MSSHIFGVRPTALGPGCSGGTPWLSRTGTYKFELELYGSSPVKTSKQSDPNDHESPSLVGDVVLADLIFSGGNHRARDKSRVGYEPLIFNVKQ